MEEEILETQLDEGSFTLSDYGPLEISLPPLPLASDEDVDAQLAGYAASMAAASAGEGAVELTDEWVRATFEGLESLDQLRAYVRADLEREARRALDDLKLQRCADALVRRVEGEIPAAILDAAVASSRDHYLARLRAAGTNKVQYMREHGIDEARFEEMMRDDIRRQMLVNIALDKMAQATGTVVANAEITEYLACEDPERFVEELQEKGRVEDARKAAARVKMMRRLVEAARIENESDEGSGLVTKQEARQAHIEG